MADECARCPDPGMCCRWLMFELARPQSADEIRWAELHPGVKIINDEDDGSWHIRLNVPCSALTPTGRCALMGRYDRPRLCGRWPDDGLKIAASRFTDIHGCVFLTDAVDRELAKEVNSEAATAEAAGVATAAATAAD